ncbi:MAG: hypothetical protein HUU32_15500 [Calditrichaceae bacterium]|nr:hypothetical protein [Calditrichia bacterium]NUQ42792.1 hypothetical protein [Calditrichaceae bacterium]
MKKLTYLPFLLFTALLLWQCARERPQALSGEMTRQLALLPLSGISGETPAGLGYINLERMRQSAIYAMLQDSLRERMHGEKELDELAEATGFDFRKDMKEVYLAFEPGPERREGNFLVVAIGKYDSQRIMDFVAKENTGKQLTPESYNEATLYRVEDKPFVLGFADEAYAVGGKEQWVKSWLDNFRAAKSEVTLDPDLAERLKPLKYKTGAWLVMDPTHLVNAIMDEMPEDADARRFEALRAVRNLNFSMDMGEEIKFDGLGQFTDAEKAKLFHDMVKGALATVKLSLSGDRAAIDVMNKIHLKTDGNNVKIDGEMSREDLEKLIRRQHGLALR